MLADTARLAVELNLTGNLKSGIAGIERQLAGLNTQTKTIGGGFKTLGAGFLVAGVRATALLAAQAGAVAGAIGVMVKEGQDAAKVQTIYAKAIANSGKVSTQYVGILNDQQKQLENLAGIDDEAIKTEQTRLIQMGLTGAQVAKLTPLILDMSKATGRDLLTSTLAVGKATNGNVAGLQRYGIMIDKAKAKVDPFGAVVDALNKKFGGTTQALSGSLEARLGAFNAALQDIREEAGIKLLPALTRIVDIAGKDLVPAFGKFVDRIMPSLLDQVNKFADALENGGAERGIKAITDALGPMVDMLKIAAAPVKLIVDAFLKLPSQVQGILIGTFAINKLSGGLIGQGAAQIIKGALGGVLGGLTQRGASPINPVFVSDVTKGLPGPGNDLLPTAAKAGLVTAAAGIAAAAIGSYVLITTIQDMAAQEVASGARNGKPVINLSGGARLGGAFPIGTFRGGLAPAINAATGFNLNATGAPSGANIASFRTTLTDAVALGTERGIVHSGVFKKAQAVREAGGFRLSRDALIASTHGKGPLGINDLISAEAIALASGNKLRSDPSVAQLRSANTNLALLKRAQAHMAADLATKLQPKIHSLEVAINRVTAAIKAKKFTVTAYLGPNQTGAHHAPGTGPLQFAEGGIVPGPRGRAQWAIVHGGEAVIPNGARASVTVNANVAVSTRDVNTAQGVKRRYGPTPTQAGAA